MPCDCVLLLLLYSVFIEPAFMYIVASSCNLAGDEIVHILVSHNNAIPASCVFATTHDSNLTTKFMFLRRIVTVVSYTHL